MSTLDYQVSVWADGVQVMYGDPWSDAGAKVWQELDGLEGLVEKRGDGWAKRTIFGTPSELLPLLGVSGWIAPDGATRVDPRDVLEPGVTYSLQDTWVDH